MKLILEPSDVTDFAYLGRSDYPPDCTYTFRVWVRGQEIVVNLTHGQVNVILGQILEALGGIACEAESKHPLRFERDSKGEWKLVNPYVKESA